MDIDKDELIKAATKLREAQEAYLSRPGDADSNVYGRKVADAAEYLDKVLGRDGKIFR